MNKSDTLLKTIIYIGPEIIWLNASLEVNWIYLGWLCGIQASYIYRSFQCTEYYNDLMKEQWKIGMKLHFFWHLRLARYVLSM